MPYPSRRAFLAASTAALTLPGAALADTALDAAIASPIRGPANIARDRYRHPAALLEFFGLAPTQSVLEIQPGGGYWTEILAPYLKPHGCYTAAVPDLTPEEQALAATFRKKLAADPADFSAVRIVPLGHGTLGAANSYGLILSFRNLHDWMAEGRTAQLLASIYTALKPGGVFGIEDHRAPASAPQDPTAKNGYVRQDYAIRLIESAGFKFLASAEIGANPRDTKNYPGGVWSLPPVLRQGTVDRAKYLAIGESDRWTLKFTK
jgi:predicted methyltransferase